MGNGVGKFTVCFSGDVGRRRHDLSMFLPEPLDEGLGHSFCYIRPEDSRPSLSKVHSEETTTFRAISGASVSANTSTPLSTSMADLYSSNSIDRAAAFESSTSFASIPLQPIPRNLMGSGPISADFDWLPGSAALERGFFSGPIERGFVSGPIDAGMFSGPIEKTGSDMLRRSRSPGDLALKLRSSKGSVMSILKRAFSKKTYRGHKSIVAPIKAMKEPEWIGNSGLRGEKHNENLSVSSNIGSFVDDDDAILYSKNLQWAQGKAGEDRVHVVVSDEHGWVFVGIYDGFNGPDAPDFLVSNLYSHVHEELKGLLWDDDKFEVEPTSIAPVPDPIHVQSEKPNSETEECDHNVQDHCSCSSQESNTESNSRRKRGRDSNIRHRGGEKKIVEAHKWWKCEWERERMELDKRLKEQLNRSGSVDSKASNHKAVLKALSEALRKTEKSYLEIADKMLTENPELALMGSCVLVMLIKGEDVYVMNVGDSRAVLAQKADPNHWLGKINNDLEKISEESLNDLESWDGERSNIMPSLNIVELSKDHSTSVDEEVQRIKAEHPNDADALMNDRVKGSLKVTRAFGAGFLKQPKWNNALLEMFRIDYLGTAPYITCNPSLYHHRLCPKDRFLILSSDGLYQYFTNEQAVSEVQHFIELQPEGDPAQHLVEQVIYRAAKKAGMDFHELLDIPQGDRRRYHDDVSIIVISLEGRIWRSCV